MILLKQSRNMKTFISWVNISLNFFESTIYQKNINEERIKFGYLKIKTSRTIYNDGYDNVNAIIGSIISRAFFMTTHNNNVAIMWLFQRPAGERYEKKKTERFY